MCYFQQHQAAGAWGILPERCYTLPEWVGGRFSLWSAIGLSIAIALGTEQFQQLLDGAKEMDEHFLTAPFVNNMPAMLAMLGIWYTNFHGAQVHGVISYAERLRYLPDYLQQLEMESNGKSINKQGEPVDYATAPVLFGGLGTTTQHSFFQLLHQGRVRVPLDIISIEPSLPPAYAGDSREADLLLFAQSTIGRARLWHRRPAGQFAHRMGEKNHPTAVFRPISQARDCI